MLVLIALLFVADDKSDAEIRRNTAALIEQCQDHPINVSRYSRSSKRMLEQFEKDVKDLQAKQDKALKAFDEAHKKARKEYEQKRAEFFKAAETILDPEVFKPNEYFDRVGRRAQPADELKINQVISPTELLLSSPDWWLTVPSTADYVDGEEYLALLYVLEVVGTKTYTTARGAKRTVRHVKVVSTDGVVPKRRLPDPPVEPQSQPMDLTHLKDLRTFELNGKPVQGILMGKLPSSVSKYRFDMIYAFYDGWQVKPGWLPYTALPKTEQRWAIAELKKRRTQ